jgi:LemA protein
MYEQRIERMRAEGLLSESQAAALQTSLTPLAHAFNRPARRTLPLASIIAAICFVALLLVAVLAIYSSAGPAAVEIQNVAETLNTPGGTGVMNRTLSLLASSALLLLPLVLIVGGFSWFYNRIVDKEERAYEAWSQVESNLQRRTDLIPNLVETVSRYMKHERETLTAITDERGDALNPLEDAMSRVLADQQGAAAQEGAAPDDEQALARLAQAQQVLGGSLKNLIAVAESYPTLRSGDQFLSLQAQLEGTENRINVARMEFNEAVGAYNSSIRRLPGTLIAALGDFKRKAYFETEGDAGRPVDVELGD